MGTSKFYYYPDGTGDDLETVDCGVGASDIQETIVRDATVTVGGTGRYTNVLHGGRAQVRIVIELGSDVVTAEKMQTLEYFLKEGNTVGFAFDSSQSYLYVLEDLPPRGVNKVVVGTNVLLNWGFAGAAVNEQVVLLSPLPSYVREHNVISAFSNGVITLQRDIQRTFLDAPALLRHKWFFPALMLAPDQRARPIVTHDHGFAWTFDATFWEDVYSLAQFDHVVMGTAQAGSIGTAFNDTSYSPVGNPYSGSSSAKSTLRYGIK
jgi:hypothetical protein